MKKTLLINANYEPLTFLNERRVFRFLALEKVEPLSYWDEVFLMNGSFHYFPSILRLKSQIHQKAKYPAFSKENVTRRDKSSCQFCGIKLSPNQVTIDHVIPKSRGGGNNFYNCVVSCFDCNNKKRNLTPEEAGMKLLKKPEPLTRFRNIFETKLSSWHEDWNYYYNQYREVI